MIIFLYYNSHITKKRCLIKSYILTAVVQKELSTRLFQTQQSEIIFAISILRVCLYECFTGSEYMSRC